MLFNSLDYLIFLPIVFLLYWLFFNSNVRFQNFFLLASSLFFYACWDIRFLLIVGISIILNYMIGILIEQTDNQKFRKFYLILALTLNVAILCFFKYFNFFVSSFIEMFSWFNITIRPLAFNIILPIGISFYTFHGMSYIIDLYRKKFSAEKNLIDYAVFVCYFPLLVAGPIERAGHLLTQLKQKRNFNIDLAISGLKQITWGLFKKIVIADNAARSVDLIYSNSSDYEGYTLMLGTFLFAIQVYGDFSGYSDIALGTSRLLGIRLVDNFLFPFFSRNFGEFWQRWHISLNTWFRDYIYIPLGGSKKGTRRTIINIFILFALSGLWHGADWTFICWGLVTALLMLPTVLISRNKKTQKSHPELKDFFSMLATFLMFCFTLIFFRSTTITQAYHYAIDMLAGLPHSDSLASALTFINKHIKMHLVLLMLFMLITEWLGRRQHYALENLHYMKLKSIRYTFYAFVIFLIGMYMNTGNQQFIYFQF